MIFNETICKFVVHLRTQGRSEGTIEKYRRDVRAFAAWLDDLELEEASGWREYLLERGYAPVTVNSMLCFSRRRRRLPEQHRKPHE